jgi:hypothetical protein
MRQDEPVRWLTDFAGDEVGQVIVERQDGDTVIGKFMPGPGYSRVEPLFREFAEAAEAQALSQVDRLDAQIARLGLRLRQTPEAEPLGIHDVQIWDNERITYRVSDAPRVTVDPGAAPSEWEQTAEVGEPRGPARRGSAHAGDPHRRGRRTKAGP